MDKNTQDMINAGVKAGQDILKSVSDAINSNDYSHLAGDITSTVKAVTFDRKTTYSSGRTVYNEQRAGMTKVNSSASQRLFPFFAKRVSRYDGLLELILGVTLGFFVALPTALGTLFLGSMVAIVSSLAFLAVCGFFSVKGIKKLKLAKAFYQYGNTVRERSYFKVSDLAKAVLKSDSEVLKDLKAMIKEGYLPRARFDSTEDTLMLTDEAYEMYLGAEKDRLAREKRELDQQKASLGVGSASRENLSGIEAITSEGEEYIRFVRATNDVIPDTEEMSTKLYRLESIMNRIFEQVKKNPQSADDLHKLMNYYLPTTKKLLDAYVELDRQSVTGDNVQQTKKEISTAMDTINEAFEKLLDSMFQDMAWDISSDISVMKTMMAQDGLTDNGGMAMQTMPKNE